MSRRDPAYALLMERLDGLVLPLLPFYQREGKSYLTIAFGCTGGRHRSIVVAERFAERLRDSGWLVSLWHRESPAADRDVPEAGGETADAGAAITTA